MNYFIISYLFPGQLQEMLSDPVFWIIMLPAIGFMVFFPGSMDDQL